MAKVYIVTEGEYSDYCILACFSTKKKAEKYVKNSKKIEGSWSSPEIEEWDLDESADIVDVININFIFTSPLSKRKYEEEIESSVEKDLKSEVFRYGEKTTFWGNDFQHLTIRRIANPNNNIEDEISKYIKVAYDTAKKIKYLYEVENLKTLKEINERL